MDPDPDMGDVTQEEGEAMEVKPPAAQQWRRRRRRRRRQREEVAAQDEQEQEYNRRLPDKVLWKCSDEELELVFPDGSGRISSVMTDLFFLCIYLFIYLPIYV